jgi:hypothetical protein
MDIIKLTAFLLYIQYYNLPPITMEQYYCGKSPCVNVTEKREKKDHQSNYHMPALETGFSMEYSVIYVSVRIRMNKD